MLKRFCRESIIKWGQDLKTLPVEISHLQNEKESEVKLKLNLEESNNKIKQEIAPIDIKIQSIEARIEILDATQSIKKLEDKIAEHHDQLTRLKPALQNKTADIAPLDLKIKNLKQLILVKELTQSTREHINHQMVYQGRISRLTSEYAVANEDLRQASFNQSQVEAKLSQLRFQMNADEFQLKELRRKRDEQAAQMPIAHVISAPGMHSLGPNSTHIQVSAGPFPSHPTAVVGSAPHIHAVTVPHRIHDDYSSEISRLELSIFQQNFQIQKFYADLDHAKHNRQNHLNTVTKIKDELTAYEKMVNKCEQDIALNNSKLDGIDYSIKSQATGQEIEIFKAQLATHENTLRPLALEKEKLSNDINASNYAVTTSKNRILDYKQRMAELSAKASSYETFNNKTELNKLLLATQEEKKPLSQQKNRLEIQISHKQQSIANLSNHIMQVTRNLEHATNNSYLNDLRDKPQHLLNRLVDKIDKSLENYENAYPNKQSYLVRAHLSQALKNKVLEIIHSKTEFEPDEPGYEKTILNNPESIKYLQACGYLHSVSKMMQANDSAFATIIDTVLDAELVTPQLCLEEYQGFLSHNPAHAQIISEQELIEREKKDYDEAKKNFQRALSSPLLQSKHYKKLIKVGNELASAIDIDLSKTESMDRKFATAILNNATCLAKKPQDTYYQNKQHFLAAHLSFQEGSNKNKCKALMLLFLGILLTVASAASYVLNPFAPLGAVAGVSLIACGSILFSKSRDKGTLKQSKEFVKAAEKVPPVKQDSSSGYPFHEPRPFSYTEDSGRERLLPEPSAPAFTN